MPCRIAQLLRRLALLPLALTLHAGAAAATPGFAPSKFAAIAIDSDGRLLYARHAEASRHPASLTKVMTLYIAFDEIAAGRLRRSDRLTISRHAAAQPPSKLGLRPGAQMTVGQALDVIAVKSANDIAVALAERIAGSEPAFVRRMNRKARALGLTHTHFANASGLPDPRNVTTAHDLARLGQAMIAHHPRGYAVFARREAQFRGHRIPGHNHLLGYHGVDGIKTGYTRASGYNLMSSTEQDGRRVVAVVLGGETAAVRDRFMRRLIRTSLTTAAPKDDAAPPPQHVSYADAEPAAAAPAAWRIQVGAYRTSAAGAARLADLSGRHPRRLPPEAGRLRRQDGLWYARFAAGSKAAAKEACDLLRTEHDECLAVEMAGGTTS